MILAIEGIDGSGKSTFISDLLRELSYHHCIHGKEKIKRAAEVGSARSHRMDDYTCCESNCAIIKQSSLDSGILHAFNDSIRSHLDLKDDDWSVVVKEFIDYCEQKDSRMIEGLFLLSFLEISNLERKNPNSIILVDRYTLSNIVYSAKKAHRFGYTIGEHAPDCDWSMEGEIKDRVNNFDWDLFPFSKKELKKFKETNDFEIILPHKTIYMDVSVSICVRHIFNRNKALTKYEHINELEFRHDVYESLVDKHKVGDVISIHDWTYEFVSVFSHGIIDIWRDFTKKNTGNFEEILLERRKNSEIINGLVESLYCDFERYHIAYEGKEYNVTSPTRILSTLTDFGWVNRYFLKVAEKEAIDSVSSYLENSEEFKAEEFFSIFKDRVSEIHKRPGQMLKKAGNIGTQTHAVIEEIIKFIIKEDDGVVVDFEKRDVLKIVNTLYQNVKQKFEGKWVINTQWEMVNQFLEYQHKHIKQWVCHELLVFSKEAEIGGRFDALAIGYDDKFIIVDFKTSTKLSRNHYAQLIMYHMIIKEYFYELKIKFSLNKGFLKQEDIATSLDEEENNYLKSLSRFFDISRKNNNGDWSINFGHLVHLRKSGGKLVVKSLDFSKLDKSKDTPKFDEKFLKTLNSSIKLINCIDDTGKGYNKKGEEVKYAVNI